jgi:hypothetical protein
VAATEVRVPDALIGLAAAPGVGPAELLGQLAGRGACRVLPAPSLPEHADLVAEADVGRILDACAAAGLEAIVDAGQRIGVETVPALERARAIALVASADRRGAVGARRLALLLGRLGLADRPLGVIAARVPRGGSGNPLAGEIGLPLWAEVREQRAVARARNAGKPPPASAFAGLAVAVGEVLAA